MRLTKVSPRKTTEQIEYYPTKGRSFSQLATRPAVDLLREPEGTPTALAKWPRDSRKKCQGKSARHFFRASADAADAR
jgi:hypothetical protein